MTDPSTSRPAAGTSRRDAIRAAVRRPARAVRRAELEGGEGGPGVRTRPAGPGVAGEAAPVFVSYARSDMGLVARLVEDLRVHTVAATWDQDLSGGIDFQCAIRDAIDAAPAVIVVWSAASAESLYVGDEARRALGQRKLVTTHVDGFDFKDLPLGFGRLNAIPVNDRARLARSLGAYGIVLPAGFGDAGVVTSSRAAE